MTVMMLDKVIRTFVFGQKMSVWVGVLCTGEGRLGSVLSLKSQSFTTVEYGMASLSACLTAPSYPLLRRL